MVQALQNSDRGARGGAEADASGTERGKRWRGRGRRRRPGKTGERARRPATTREGALDGTSAAELGQRGAWRAEADASGTERGMMRRGYIQQAGGDIAKIEEGRMRDGDGGTDGTEGTDGIRLRAWGATARSAYALGLINGAHLLTRGGLHWRSQYCKTRRGGV